MAEKQLSTQRNLLFLITLVTVLLLLPAAATIAIDADFLRCVTLLQRLEIGNLSSLPPNLHFPSLNGDSSLIINELNSTNYIVSEYYLFGTTSLPYFVIDHSFFNVTLLEPLGTNADPFSAVSYFLKSNGFSVMAAFLDAQLSKEFRNGGNFTIFAPLDSSFRNGIARSMIGDYSRALRKYVVPRRITWRELISLPDKTLLPTLSSNGFIIVTSLWVVPFVNGVQVAVPDMFVSDLVVVHGIYSLLHKQSAI
ncbi:hypothetical protein PIB30_051734 [Stylosanthes scabra]|uniref:FAS1 domain-containing protein n=1 Tax=Stylosanthes scabra TaxID=79078 RepID=A0ABU6SJK4_9FABA|nr:hypothetical protein [Stylosanthes scabra]